MKASMNVLKRSISWASVTWAAAVCVGCGNTPLPAAISPPMTPMTPMPIAPAPLPQAGPCDATQQLATSTAMHARAAAEAPGMKPEGPPVCGVVAEGQAYTSAIFTIEQGYCYTFLGQSLPPVGQMEMILQGDASGLVAPLFPSMSSAAQAPLLVSTTPGERVNMGEKQNCYAWALPIPATVKLILKARAGSGPVGAQVYRKKRL